MSSKTATEPKLYVKARVIGYRRAKHAQKLNTSLIQIENVENKTDADFYVGKRIAYLYRAKNLSKGVIKGSYVKCDEPTKIRVVWGKIIRPHGNGGAVRAKFRRNLPPSAHGKPIRVMLYPSKI